MLIGIAALTLTLAACTNTAQDTDNSEKSGQLTAKDGLVYDFGDIDIEGGVVKKGFDFTNTGDTPITLKGANTSCMCTSAYAELPDGSKSPTISMQSSIDWSYTIEPGEEFEMEVMFDPMAHGPDSTGQISRTVYLVSNAELDGNTTKPYQLDSRETVTEISIKTNVLYSAEYKEKYGDSPFQFEETEFDFGVLKQSQGFVSHDFEFTYTGTDPIQVTGVPASCACTIAEISQTEFKKGDKGILTVQFDTNLHEEPEGKFFKTVSILTSPALPKQPEIKIWAEMDLDLGPDAYKLKQHQD